MLFVEYVRTIILYRYVTRHRDKCLSRFCFFFNFEAKRSEIKIVLLPFSLLFAKLKNLCFASIHVSFAPMVSLRFDIFFLLSLPFCCINLNFRFLKSWALLNGEWELGMGSEKLTNRELGSGEWKVESVIGELEVRSAWGIQNWEQWFVSGELWVKSAEYGVVNEEWGVGHWEKGTKSWKCLESGVWCVVCGVWCVVCGVCCAVCGAWCVVCSVRCVVCGVRCVVCGVRCVVWDVLYAAGVQVCGFGVWR